jgi:vitamin B12 transporter
MKREGIRELLGSSARTPIRSTIMYSNSPYRGGTAALRSKTIALAALAAALSPPAFALVATDAEPPVVLPTLVVTATRTPTDIAATAATVSVISRDQIEAAGLTSAAAALKTVPGLTIADGGMPGQAVGVYTRGTESRHTVILLNGQRLPSGLQRYYDLSYLPLNNIERIEVVRGPVSTAQGSGAIGGAINFITTAPEAGAPSGRIAGEVGSYESRRVEASAAVANDTLRAQIGATHFTTENARPNSQFEATSTLNQLGWKIAPTADLSLLFGGLKREGGSPGSGTATTVSDPNETFSQELGWLAPTLKLTPSERWTHTLGYSYAHQDTEARNSAFSNNQTEVVSQSASYQADLRATDTVSLMAGAEWTRQALDYTPTAGNFTLPFARTERAVAGFAGATIELAPELFLTTAVRRDVYEDFYGAANTWRYGVSYRFAGTGTRIHAAEGTAFAAPEAQNFLDYGTGPLADTLRPERSRSQEIGVEQDWAKGRVTTGATVFRSEITDLAQYDFGTNTVENIGEAEIYGVESSLAWRVSDTVRFTTNYTYQSAKNALTDTALVRRPRHAVNADLNWQALPAWSLGGSVRGVMRRTDGFGGGRIEDYGTVRLYSTYALQKNLLLRARIENLLDEDYAELKGFPALGRTVYAGIEWRF